MMEKQERVKWVVHPNLRDLNEAAANVVLQLLIDQSRPVIGFATGSSPLGLYQAIVKKSLANPVLLERWKNVTGFNLDEYVGLPESHPQSYHAYMQENLYQYISIPKSQVYIPKGNGNLEDNCRAHEQALARHGFPDLQILGIGKNGHIGFNEPAEELTLETHVTPLTDNTRKANARFFDSLDEVPTHAITMGIGDILRAKRILLLAFGEEKKMALLQAFSGNVSSRCPASLLQLHENVTVFTDQDVNASSLRVSPK